RTRRGAATHPCKVCGAKTASVGSSEIGAESSFVRSRSIPQSSKRDRRSPLPSLAISTLKHHYQALMLGNSQVSLRDGLDAARPVCQQLRECLRRCNRRPSEEFTGCLIL